VIPFAPESGRVRYRGGDQYRFGLTLVGECRAMAAGLEERLASCGAHLQPAAPGGGNEDDGDRPGKLAGNLEVLSIVKLPAVDLKAESARLLGHSTIVVQFLSPMRLPRPKALRVEGADFVNGDCFPVEHFLSWLYIRLYLLEHGRYPTREERLRRMPPIPSEASTIECDLHWLDLPIETPPGGPPRARGQVLGGVVGRVVLGGIPEEWIPWLALGRHLHAGDECGFGLGRYAVGPAPEDEPFRPAQTYLGNIASTLALNQALDQILARSEPAGVDGIRPEDVDANRGPIVEELSESLVRGTYRPQPLLGSPERQQAGGARASAVPTVRDRIVQQAAAETIRFAVSALLEDCAFAYRRALSRGRAVQGLARAYEDGFRYVLDADVAAFQDHVSWPRVSGRLRALFPLEPLVDLIEQWIRQDVVCGGRTLKRRQGLPQGSPIAPVVAELSLDEVDDALRGQEYRLIRHGHDFVVLCKDLESVTEARDLARRASGRSDPAANAAVPSSWLAHVPLERVRALVPKQGKAGAGIEVVPIPPPSVPLESRRPLYLTHRAARIRLRGDALEIRVPKQEPLHVPVRAIAHVVAVGSVRLTLRTLLGLNHAGVSVFFCRRSGELSASLHPHAPEWGVWMAQAAAAGNDALRLSFAREIVMARLHNVACLVTRPQLPDGESAAEQIRAAERECLNQDNPEALRELEEQGAAVYFGVMREDLDPAWGFTGRLTHPSPDPVNAMLTLGYALIRHHLSTALIAAGLNPQIGLFHKEREGPHALARDLLVELQHLVDGLVWGMVKRGAVQPEGFSFSTEDRFPCLMRDETRRKFITGVEQRLAVYFSPEPGRSMTYREFMAAQARQVRDVVAGRQAIYRPLRLHTRPVLPEDTRSVRTP
jgi:CRISPR-associated protein Cas1